MRAFENRNDLAEGLAREVAAQLSAAISRQDFAILAVSGGTTPRLFFDNLSRAEISWDKVVVTLVDERDVPETSERSNARLVRQALLKNRAEVAAFVALHDNPYADEIGNFDVCILGMGNDGHTASFFPHGDTLAKAIDPVTSKGVMAISAPGAGEPRLTFTLSKLLASRHILLHIEGAEKARVLQDAMAGHDPMHMPVRAVLNAGKPLQIYWCP
jgi:6-phosphogluconolactonase